MNKRFRRWVVIGGILAGGGLLAGCNGRGDSFTTHKAPLVAPTVVEAVRHYAGLMARGIRLTTPASRWFAGVAPNEQAAGNASPDYSVSLLLAMPAYEVVAFLDHQQRVRQVSVEPPRPYEDPNRLAKDVRRPLMPLVRLGELQRAFGPGTKPPENELQDRIHFAYRPSSDARQLTIRAFLPQQTSTNSSIVNEIDIFIE